MLRKPIKALVVYNILNSFDLKNKDIQSIDTIFLGKPKMVYIFSVFQANIAIS